MKKRTALLLAITVMTAFLVLPAASGAADRVYTFNMGSIFAEPANVSVFNSFGVAKAKFAELVQEKSGGRIVIRTFYNSVLGSEVDMLDQIQKGDLDIFLGQAFATANPKFGATSIPYLFRDFDHIVRATYGADAPVYKLMSSWYDEIDVKLLALSGGNLRGFISSRPVVLPTDLRGMTVRTVEDFVTHIFWSGLTIATPMPIGEVYTALQTGVVDGLEFSAASSVGRRYYEVSGYFVDIDWRWAATGSFSMNPDAFDSLPSDLREILIECAWEAAAWQTQTEINDVRNAYAELESRGVTVHRLSDSERQAWIDYARSLDDRFRAEMGADAVDAMLEAVRQAE